MTVAEQVISVFCGVKGHLDDIEQKNIADFENKIIEKCKSEKPEILDSIKSSGKLEEDAEKSLTEVISENPNYLELHLCQIVRVLIYGIILKLCIREDIFITVNDFG